MVKVELGLDMVPSTKGKDKYTIEEFLIEYNKMKLKEERVKKLKKLNNYVLMRKNLLLQKKMDLKILLHYLLVFHQKVYK